MHSPHRLGLSFLSAHLRLALALAALLCLVGTLARIGFALWFAPAGAGIGGAGWGSAFLLGLRFDARSALVSVALAWLLSALPWLGPRLRPPARARFWRAYWMLAGLVWALGLIFDAGQYAYLAQRLSSVLFTLARDAGEATGMVWQSYPVLWIALGLGLAMLLWYWAFAYAWRWAVRHGAQEATLRTRLGEVWSGCLPLRSCTARSRNTRCAGATLPSCRPRLPSRSR